MPSKLGILATAALALGCATHRVEPDTIGAAGSELAGVPTPGQPFAAELTTTDGEAITLPDPSGRVVVLELIRSADW